MCFSLTHEEGPEKNIAALRRAFLFIKRNRRFSLCAYSSNFFTVPYVGLLET